MENKETVVPTPLGVCEKLFNVLHLNPTLRSFRRISYGHPQGPVAQAVAVPAASPPPLAPSPGSRAPTPSTRPCGHEHPPVAASGSPHQPGFSEKKAPEARPPRMEEPKSSIGSVPPSRVPSIMVVQAPEAAAIPSKNIIIPQASPPQLLTKKGSNSPSKTVVVHASSTPGGAPAPEKVSSNPKSDGGKSSVVDNLTTTGAVEAGGMRTRKNLNEKVEEYINRTRNRMRTSSNAGSSSSSFKR